jgi:GntR family transcriptional regulator, N-acetylglucosamine utilization regulator
MARSAHRNGLDRNSPIPLYDQLKAAIDERIESGEWSPETQVPSERGLCEQFQISRITVRQALNQLVSDGRLIRIHGRGTYVAPSPLKKCLLPLVGFSEDMLARGQKPGAHVLQFESATAPPHVARALELGAWEEIIILKRLRLANGRPMAVETVHIPKRVCPGLLQEDLEDRSFYQLLKKKYGISPVRAAQQWQAVACPTPDAKLLGIRRGSPVLRIQRTTFEREGHPFEHLESFFRGDRYIFYAELLEQSRELVGQVLPPPEVRLAKAGDAHS